MSIKPWLSKNFLHMMTWSSVRDYPPKKKKPWLFDNFMEMEETHSDHMEEPFGGPILPLPPSPDIPQEPEPDPCGGDRTLWVTIAPTSSIDCSVDSKFSLLFSPDFRCIEIKQLFFDDNKSHIIDSNDNTFEYFTNIADIIGNLTIEKSCEDTSSITVMARDCLCDGFATADIWLENCEADCTDVAITGPFATTKNDTEQFILSPFAGDVTWGVIGVGATMDQNGKLTTTNACGTLTVQALTSCCGGYQRKVRVSDNGVWVLLQDICHTVLEDSFCTIVSPEAIGTIYGYTCSPPAFCSPSPPPCGSCGGGTQYTQSVRTYRWDCPP